MFDRIPTLADVCSAIADGQLAVSLDGSTYQISALELRRFIHKSRGLPSLSTVSAQDARPHSASDGWEPSIQTSVA